jgi:hypothetical protein
MTALAAERSTPRMGSEQTGSIPVISLKVKTGVTIYKGALVCIDNTTGYAVPGSTATTLIAVGVAEATVAAGAAASGTYSVNVRRGVFPFVNLGADALVQGDCGKTCFITDDQTVSKTNGGATKSNAGVFWGFDENSMALVEVGIRSATGV